MQIQQTAHAQIAVPADCLAPLAAPVARLQGQLESGSSLEGCFSMPYMERGGKMLKGLRQRVTETGRSLPTGFAPGCGFFRLFLK